MAKSIKIETGSPFTKLFFNPFVGSKGFVGYLDVVAKSTDGATTIHLKVYRGKDRNGNDEYYVLPKASHRTPLLNEDGSPTRNDKGEPMYNEKVYGSADKEMAYRIKVWLTPVLTHFFIDHPDGKVAQNVAEQAQPVQTSKQPGHVVAEDGEDSDRLATRGY